MEILKWELRTRNNLMNHCYQKFLHYKITNAVCENFARALTEGFEIVSIISFAKKLTQKFKERIKTFLITCKETIMAAALEVPEEYCMVLEIMEDFRERDLLVIRLLDGDLDDSSFM